MARNDARSGPPRRRRDGRRFFPRRKVCSFCVDHIKEIDFKDVTRLRRHVTEWAKIEPRRRSGVCAPHQRDLARALRRARYMALLPFTGDHSLMDLSRQDGGFRRDRDGGRFRRDRDGGSRYGAPAPVAGVAPVAAKEETAAVAADEPAVEATVVAEAQVESPSAETTDAPAVAEETAAVAADEPAVEATAEAEAQVESPSAETTDAPAVAEETPAAEADEPAEESVAEAGPEADKSTTTA